MIKIDKFLIWILLFIGIAFFSFIFQIENSQASHLNNNIYQLEIFERFDQGSTEIEFIDINSASHDIETGVILILITFIPWVLYRKYKRRRNGD